MADLKALFERAEADLPGVKRRRTPTQEVLDLIGFQGFAWRPLKGSEVLQIYPPTKGSQTFREGDYFVVKRRTSQDKYFDPGHSLNPNQFSYVGCNCSALPDDQVWIWIKQAYGNLKRDKGAPSQQVSPRTHPSSSKTQTENTREAKLGVVGIESLYRPGVVGKSPFVHPGWLRILAAALEELPKGYQSKQANELLAGALEKTRVRFQSEVKVGPESGHTMDFLIEFNGDRVGVEFGTGQAERVELDLLKLISLALEQGINYACLILPQDVMRHSVFGTQKMRTAVENLAQLCSPILTLTRERLKDAVVIWYV